MFPLLAVENVEPSQQCTSFVHACQTALGGAGVHKRVVHGPIGVAPSQGPVATILGVLKYSIKEV